MTRTPSANFVVVNTHNGWMILGTDMHLNCYDDSDVARLLDALGARLKRQERLTKWRFVPVEEGGVCFTKVTWSGFFAMRHTVVQFQTRTMKEPYELEEIKEWPTAIKHCIKQGGYWRLQLVEEFDLS